MTGAEFDAETVQFFAHLWEAVLGFAAFTMESWVAKAIALVVVAIGAITYSIDRTDMRRWEEYWARQREQEQ